MTACIRTCESRISGMVNDLITLEGVISLVISAIALRLVALYRFQYFGTKLNQTITIRESKRS